MNQTWAYVSSTQWLFSFQADKTCDRVCVDLTTPVPIIPPGEGLQKTEGTIYDPQTLPFRDHWNNCCVTERLQSDRFADFTISNGHGNATTIGHSNTDSCTCSTTCAINSSLLMQTSSLFFDGVSFTSHNFDHYCRCRTRCDI